MTGVVGAFRSLDEEQLRLLVRWGSRPSISGMMRIASRLGDGGVWYGAGFLAAAAGGAAGRRVALLGLVAGCLNTALYRICKRRILRARPFRALPDLPILWSPPDDASFPSGHALHAFAAATLIAVAWPVLALPAFLLAGLIALSRVVLAVHYPSDVLAGALLGAVIGGTLAVLL